MRPHLGQVGPEDMIFRLSYRDLTGFYATFIANYIAVG